VRGKPGARVELEVEFLGGAKHLPVIRLKRAAQQSPRAATGLAVRLRATL
jgi:hypothetical protein